MYTTSILTAVLLLAMNMDGSECAFAHSSPVVRTSIIADKPIQDEQDLPIRGEIRKTYQLQPNGNIDVSGIEGSVEVETTSVNTVELHFVREAKTQTDYDCETINIEDSPANLTVRHTTKKEPQCRVIQAREQLKLVVPRSAHLAFSHIEGGFSVGVTDGFLRLSWIEGAVHVGQTRAADISWVESGLSLNVAQVGTEGINVHHIEGPVELGVAEKVNAELRVGRHSGKVQVAIPNAQTIKAGQRDYQLQLGSGGAQISISAIEGDINIRSI